MTLLELTRREALRLLAGVSGAAAAAAARAQVAEDRGIGGTGVVPDETLLDRGIGGTGVVGTIRKFGSVVVNDLRITYDRHTLISVDGRPSAPAALRLGQVVRTLALPRGAGLYTRHIAVVHEVVGRIEQLSKAAMTVLGQPITLDQLARRPRLRIGDQVAVSGLRTPDGVIVASDVVRVSRIPSQLRGRLDANGAGGLSVGGVVLEGADPSLRDQRVVVTGSDKGGRFVPRTVEGELDALLRLRPRRLSVEQLAVVSDGLARLDGQLAAPNGTTSGAAPYPDGIYRAVVTSSLQADGSYAADSVRISDRVGSTSHSTEGGASHRSPGAPPGGGFGFDRPGGAPGPGDGHFGFGGASPASRSGLGPGGGGPGGGGAGGGPGGGSPGGGPGGPGGGPGGVR